MGIQAEPNRLVLFDIDETILKSDGAGRRAISRALNESFATQIDSSPVKMSGKTDKQICQEILHLGGYSREQVQHRLEDVLDLYIGYLKEEVSKSTGYRLHEGVLDLIAILHEHQSAYLGLLTGNIERGARIKLERFGLNAYFKTGAFGCDSADRMDLPAIAVQRALEEFTIEFKPQDVVIIGDSVHDIACAKAHGAISIAVNTGLTSYEELQALSPDYLFASLKHTDLVLQAIFS